MNIFIRQIRIREDSKNTSFLDLLPNFLQIKYYRLLLLSKKSQIILVTHEIS